MALPYRYFTYTVNGRPGVDYGAYTNTPPGYQEVDLNTFLNTAKKIPGARGGFDINGNLLGQSKYDELSQSGELQKLQQSSGYIINPETGQLQTQSSYNESKSNGQNLDAITAVNQVLGGLQARGLTLNPNISITPQVAAEFMSFSAQNINAFLPYAQKELAPYYQTQLKIASDTLQRGLGYSQERIAQNEQDIEKRYANTLEQIGVSAAERGLAQSGRRILNEQNLAAQTQNEINRGRSNLAYNLGNTAGGFAQRYGSENLPDNRTLAPAPRVIAGQAKFDITGPRSSLYTLSPDVYSGLTGSEQFAERAAEQARASQLEEAYNKYNTLSRTLPS